MRYENTNAPFNFYSSQMVIFLSTPCYVVEICSPVLSEILDYSSVFQQLHCLWLKDLPMGWVSR